MRSNPVEGDLGSQYWIFLIGVVVVGVPYGPEGIVVSGVEVGVVVGFGVSFGLPLVDVGCSVRIGFRYF